MRIWLLVALLCLGTSAHADFTKITRADKFRAAVTGKVLTRPLIRLEVSPDGNISGTGAMRAVQGRWSWRGGFFCRDLRWGDREIAYNCQEVRLNGSKIRFTSDKGRGDFADFRLQPR
jgi:hypothetical protein